MARVIQGVECEVVCLGTEGDIGEGVCHVGVGELKVRVHRLYCGEGGAVEYFDIEGFWPLAEAGIQENGG